MNGKTLKERIAQLSNMTYTDIAKRLNVSEQIRSIFNLPYQLTNRGRDRENRYNIALDCFRLSFSLAGMNAADLYDCTSINGNTIHYYRVKTRDRRADRAEMQIDIPWQAMPYSQRYLDALHKRGIQVLQNV